MTIDLLSDDDTLWLETLVGVPFVSLSDGWIVFVWRRDAKRDSGECAAGSINTRTKKGGWVETGLDGQEVYYPMATALRKAQEWVIDSGFQLPSKYASWRQRNQAPSGLQVGLARRLNIVGAETFTKGRLSDEISIAFASKVLNHAMEG